MALRESSKQLTTQFIPCNSLFELISDMLSERKFRVYLNNDKSTTFTLNNGLPQGSVLAPLFFNVLISDLTATTNRKCGYADGKALAT